MRVIAAGCALALLAATFAAPAMAGVIDDELQAVLAEAPADEAVSTLVFMADRVDVKLLAAELEDMRANRQFRHERVVTALQRKAAEAQVELLADLEERAASGVIESYKSFWISNAIAVKATPDEIRRIAARDDVRTVYFDYPIELINPVEGVPEVRGGGPISTGDITSGVEAVRAPEVWDMGFDGTGVLVSTLDTGVDGNHEALELTWRGRDERYADNPEWAWFDPVTDTTFPTAFGGHGTHTMGSVCGGPPGEHIGVAPGAEWIHAAVIDRQSIQRTVQDALLSFEWILDPDGNPNTVWDVPQVNSNSWGVTTGHGYSPCDETFWDHLDACEAGGIVMLFSAGNEGFSGLRRPADRASTDYDSCAVAAVDANNPNWPIAGFSSRGPTDCTDDGSDAIKPDIAAPGVNVRSALPGRSSYGSLSGTSMASPHVNGVVALMLQANPGLSTQEVKQIIYDTAFDLGDPEEDNNYGWGMIDAFEAVQVALSLRSIRFEYPDGKPELIDPNGGTVMRVEVLGSEKAQPEPGTGVLHYFQDDQWVEVAMQQVEDNIYDAVFPAVPCMEDLMYYLSADTTDGDTVTDPFNAPERTYSATGLIGYADYFADNFENDMGWSVVNENLDDGAWERAVPFGSGDPAPDADFDGSGNCYVTGNSVFQDVDGGPTRLISPRIDLAGRLTTINFAQYFVSGSTDRMQVEVSNDDGGSWTLVSDNEPNPDGWIEASFVVADFVAPTADVRVRFSVADNPNNSFCEAGVDAFLIVETLCGDGGGCVREPAWQCDGDVDGDGQVNPVDSGIVQSAFGSGDDQDLCNYDLDCDGQINPVDAGIVQSLFGTCEPVREVCP